MMINPMRATGLASGMDIEGIIQKMMSAQRMSGDKLFQKQQTIEWQRAEYRSLNTAMYDFRNTKLTDYRLEGNFSAKQVVASGGTGVTAKARGIAMEGTYHIEVSKLASAATTIGGELGNYDRNAALGANYVGQSFKINGTSINIEEGDTLNSILTKINKQTDVSAYYDESRGSIVFMSKKTGFVNDTTNSDGSKITFSNDSFVANVLKIGPNAEVREAVQAELSINGISRKENDNTFAFNGIDITLNAKDQGITTLTVKADVDALVDKVKAFINDYNGLLKTLNDKIGESRYRTFHPLTDAQKKEMSDREVEMWEEKAKSGLMRNDPIYTQAISDMRMSIISKVETGSDKYNNLLSIGITTGTYTENGKLYLDEEKLRKAIEEDPDAIVQMFTSSGTGNGDEGIGVAKQLYNAMQAGMNRITDKAGFAGAEASTRDDSIIGRELDALIKQIDNHNRRMQDMEARYYRQFAAMESAINKYSAQSTYLMNAFGGGQQ